MTLARSLLVVLLCLILGACTSDSAPPVASPPTPAQVVTENQLAADTQRQVTLEELLVLSLEDPRDESTYLDTGEVGLDIIPYLVEQPTTLTLDAEGFGGLAFRILLSDAEGYLVAQTETGVAPETVSLEPGHYRLMFEHLYMYNPEMPSDIAKPETIFVSPRTDSAAPQVQQSSGLVTVLKLTGYCYECNLVGVDLRGVRLPMVNLRGSDMRMANLSSADLSSAYLSRVNLYDANLSYADLSGANLSGANLTVAYLYEANLSYANLSYANLSHADLTNTRLGHANLTGATWTDGRTCAEGSIGECR